MKAQKTLHLTLFTVMFLILSQSSFAQSPPPPPPAGGTPIDGGILMLAAAGVGYGAYQRFKKSPLR